ncbi:MAG: hypothetical protein Tsb0018_12290 [Opitutales bacterium]|tara:strand:+ start:520 stop:1437 length:918 start_codon:yes stop_codon:yes gene_type:complete
MASALPKSFAWSRLRLFFVFLSAVTLVWSTTLWGATATRRDAKGNLNPVRKISHEEGEQRLAAFRNQRLSGDYCFQFELVEKPRRGEATHYYGLLWGRWTPFGPQTRLSLWPKQPVTDIDRIQVLVYGGPQPQAWLKAQGSTEVQAIKDADLLNPLIATLLYTPFDLQMPFIFWEKWSYEGATRLQGRPTHLFSMYPPEGFVKANPNIGSVRIALDEGFNVMLRAQVVSPNGKIEREFSAISFKKVGEQWVVKSIKLVDLTTRDKSQFTVLSAALNPGLDPSIFDPNTLATMPELPKSLEFVSLN